MAINDTLLSEIIRVGELKDLYVKALEDLRKAKQLTQKDPTAFNFDVPINKAEHIIKNIDSVLAASAAAIQEEDVVVKELALDMLSKYQRLDV